MGEGKSTYAFSANANVLSAFPLNFCLRVTSRRGGCDYTLAERYGERIRCFTPPLILCRLRIKNCILLKNIYLKLHLMAKDFYLMCKCTFIFNNQVVIAIYLNVLGYGHRIM
jgi:hypothetical protein